jgi:hypothetical protein
MLSLKMFPRMRSTWLRNLATIAGTLAIAIPVVFYKPSTLFPGLSALVPCLGSVLIIGAGESGSSFIGSVLSWRPVAFVGLISYSLYLWHWPVIILHKMGILLTMESVLPRWWAAQISVYGSYKFNQIIEVAVSLILAVLSWWLVERPFRSGRLRLTGKPLFTLAGATMLIFVTYSVWAIQSGGFKGRFSADSVRLASYLDNKDNYSAMRMGTCFISTGSHFEDYNKNICLHQEAGKDNYLLLGDSHSAMLWAALSSSFPNVNLMQASTSSCAPFVHPSGDSACIKMMNYFYQSYLPTHPIRGLILDKRWEAHDLSALTETISWARNHKVPVILLGPVPEYDAPLPRLEAYAVAWNQPNLVSQHRVLGIQNVDAQLQSLAASWDVTYVSLFQAICGSGNSIEYADPEHKVPLMFDEDHLTPPGSILIVRRLMDQGKISLGGKLGR